MLPSPIERIETDSVKVPFGYDILLAEYQKRLALERQDCLVEILLAFNAFQGTMLIGLLGTYM